jgi:hypothetical protein
MTKRAATARGAVFGFMTFGAIGFAVVLVRGVSRAATFQSGKENFPLLGVAAAGGVLGAVLERAEWQRECG